MCVTHCHLLKCLFHSRFAKIKSGCVKPKKLNNETESMSSKIERQKTLNKKMLLTHNKQRNKEKIYIWIIKQKGSARIYVVSREWDSWSKKGNKF